LVGFPAVETACYSHSSLRDKEILSNEVFPKPNKRNLFTAAVFGLKKL